MQFNSLEFILFVVAFFVLWPVVRGARQGRWIYLTCASFFFYGWWDWRFLFLILASGFIDFFASLAMKRWPGQKRIFLLASIAGNLGSLGAFKYLDFFTQNLNWVVESFGGQGWTAPGLVLPLGISFYTFQSMSYTLDVYRGALKPTSSVFHFFAYLSMFPQLVAGPIVRAADLLPQLERPHPTTTEQTRWEGLTLITCGFFKKVVVADTLAPVVNRAFWMVTPLDSCSYWWIVMVMFAIQIYCDFSGYSDIARGLAKWMGYEFPRNFDHPYIAVSMREFWTRWHISLSTWFRDYVYFPLGGSRRSSLSGHANLWITMLVSGFWHGAAWTFVIWGALHAAYLSLERATNWPAKLARLRGGKSICLGIVFMMVTVAWVFFRARTLGQAGLIVLHMFDLRSLSLDGLMPLLSGKALLLTALMAARQLYVYLGLESGACNDWRIVEVLRPAALALILVACIFFRGPTAGFIYFQF